MESSTKRKLVPVIHSHTHSLARRANWFLKQSLARNASKGHKVMHTTGFFGEPWCPLLALRASVATATSKCVSEGQVTWNRARADAAVTIGSPCDGHGLRAVDVY